MANRALSGRLAVGYRELDDNVKAITTGAPLSSTVTKLVWKSLDPLVALMVGRFQPPGLGDNRVAVVVDLEASAHAVAGRLSEAFMFSDTHKAVGR